MTIDSLALVGQTLAEKYVVEAAVGEGGFAVVYRARHVLLGNYVAIKVFRALAHFTHGDREALLAAFFREGRLLAELSERSNAICQARDVGTFTTSAGERLPYLVLEWLDGQSLQELLDDERAAGTRPRSLDEVITTLAPIAEALATAHERGVVHRDMKPANVFAIHDRVTGERLMKLLDFGIAKVVGDVQGRNGHTRPPDDGRRRLASFTPAYGAPEQFEPERGRTGPWTDVFGLALIVVELVTGREALGGGSFEELRAASCDPLRRPTPFRHGVLLPPRVESVLACALAIDPMQRFSCARELWRALTIAHATTEASDAWAKLAATLPADAGSATPRVRRSVPRRANASTIAVAVAAAILGVETRGISASELGTPSTPAHSSNQASGAATHPVASHGAAAASCPTGMIHVPGGKFFMGSDDPRALDLERPVHQVTLSGFCMDRFEVTTAAYRACSEVGDCLRAGRENVWEGISAGEQRTFDPLCNARDADGRGTHPINCVDWAMASTYCEAKGARLPTEAEWEFAARGPDGRMYPWGDEPPSALRLNACGAECAAWGRRNRVALVAMYGDDDGFASTAPVGSFPAGRSRWGIEDVVGNVWEWVADRHAAYTSAPSTNPSGPPDGEERVIRGGAWNGTQPSWVRPTFRYHAAPTNRSHGVGFRCARAEKGAATSSP